jgi:predicted ferric reductase
MTATAEAPARTTSPSDTARYVLLAVVAVNVLIIWALFFTDGEGKNSTLSVAKFFAMNAALIMMTQIVLVSRLPWLDRRIGMDRLTSWHRWVGFGLLWTVLLHVTFILLGYARLDDTDVFSTFGALAGVTASLLGMIAATALITVALTSIRAIRRRVSYETWHALHMLVYVTIFLGLVHQYLEPATFKESTFGKVYWTTLWTLVIAALLTGRLLIPLWRNAYHQYRVAEVVPESDNVTSVHITGRNLDRLPARAGQFMIWRFPRYAGWWPANPFSLSAAPDGRSLRLTAKAVGATSAGLRSVPVGTRVYVEGPYGAFTSLHRSRDAALLIAGGVGVTPIRALLEESEGPVVVLYRVRDEADAVLLHELRELAAVRGADVHLVTGRTSAASAAGAPLGPENLARLVPDIADRDVFVCGPPAMTSAVLRSLRELKVPRRQVHAERFSLA